MTIFYPLELLSKWITYNLLSIPENSYLGSSLEFFIFDVLKIFILMLIFIFIVSLIRLHFPPEKIRKLLDQKKVYLGNLIASLIGIITPFCSCSGIPLFLSFIEVGIPIGVCFSFIIASPMINEVALILLLSLFGWKVALIYIFSGLVISVIAGIILGKINAEKWISNDLLAKSFPSTKSCHCHSKKLLWKDKLSFAGNYTFSIFKKIWLYVVIGVGIGAWIHGYIPNDFLTKYAHQSNWYSVPLAVLIGIPLYSNAAGVIPLVSTLTEKGLPMGTVLAFMMAVTGLSLPEFFIMKRIMKFKLILIFAAIVGIGIIFVGYLFNFLLA